VFAPVSIGGRAYVDGGAWSPTNMDAVEAPAGSVVLCLNPTGSMRVTGASLLGALGSLSRTVAGAEALALRHRGYHVDTVDPDRASASAMGVNLMDSSRREQVIAAGLAQGRALAAGAAERAA
jgi:NTE family protein